MTVATTRMPDLARLDTIKRRLAIARPAAEPRARLLATAEGPVSRELLEALERPWRDASVLLALLERPSGLTMLFTERAAHLRDHAGQISFPGGRITPGETAIGAALREAAEEVELAPQDVAVLGCLDVHLTVTGFAVTPVIGSVRADFRPRPDPTEVASAFEVPLEFLLDARNMRVVYGERLGTRFRTYELHYAGHRIWGATAVMLNAFKAAIVDDGSST